MTNRVRVTFIFPLADQQRLMVHLAGWDWPFSAFGPVDLLIGDQRIRMLHEGSANMHGTAAVRLALCDADYQSIDDVMNVVSNREQDEIALEFLGDGARM